MVHGVDPGCTVDDEDDEQENRAGKQEEVWHGLLCHLWRPWLRSTPCPIVLSVLRPAGVRGSDLAYIYVYTSRLLWSTPGPPPTNPLLTIYERCSVGQED